MWQSLQHNWRIYLIEAWALGIFMLSACVFAILLEHPGSSLHQVVNAGFARRALMGLAMGATAVCLIYSPWGKRSGAHMNPAVTLANLQMERISWQNALWYIAAQFAGGALSVFLVKIIAPQWLADTTVNYVATLPNGGIVAAFAAEFTISFFLLTAVLHCSNSRYASLTGWLAGLLVAVYITFEAPLSGMSMNPARTIASALPGNIWTGWWIYFAAPIGGMVLAGYLYRWNYRRRHLGNCLSMKCHLSGNKHNCDTYEVLGPASLIKNQV
jgi:aquaporin Z